MKLIRCDNHPDREAIMTLSIKILPLGARPFFIGNEFTGKVIDLCEECRDNISLQLKAKEDL